MTSDSGFSLDWGHCTVFLDKTLNTYSVSLIQVLGGTSKLNNGTTYDTSACTLTGLSSCTIIHIIICELYYFLCSIHGHGPPMIPVHWQGYHPVQIIHNYYNMWTLFTSCVVSMSIGQPGNNPHCSCCRAYNLHKNRQETQN